MEENFYFISYNLPAEPSRIRVYVWRCLKRIGALNIQQSLWLLPDVQGVSDELDKIKSSIEKDGGIMYIVLGKFLHGPEDIIKRFIDERDREYDELLEYCKKFHEEMRYETEIKNFTFAELEENEEEYNKLLNWYGKIKKRDYFNSQKGITAEEEISLCRAEFEEFSSKVYQSNS